MELTNTTARHERARVDRTVGAPGTYTVEGRPLPVTGPGERSAATDDLVRVVAGVSDPSGILSACTVELVGRFMDGGDLVEGALVAARTTTLVAETVPVARSMAIVPRFTFTATGPGNLVLVSYLAAAAARVEGSP